MEEGGGPVPLRVVESCLVHWCKFGSSGPRSRSVAARKTDIVDAAVPLVEAMGTDVSNKALKIVIQGKLNELFNSSAVSRAKKDAVKSLVGNPVEDIQRLPSFMVRLREVDSDTHTDIRLRPGSVEYKSCFIAPGAAVRCIRSGSLRPLFTMDACHVRGAYLGVMLICIAFGPGDELVLLAYAHAPSETTESWTYFCEHLVAAFPSLLDTPSHIISDQDKGLENAVRSCIPRAFHAACLFHRMQKITPIAKRSLLSAMARATTLKHYAIAYSKLQSELSASDMHTVTSTAPHLYCLSHMVLNERDLRADGGHWAQCGVPSCKFSWMHFAASGATAQSDPFDFIARDIVFPSPWGHTSNQGSESFNGAAKLLGIRTKNICDAMIHCYAKCLDILMVLRDHYVERDRTHLLLPAKVTKILKATSDRCVQRQASLVDVGARTGQVLSSDKQDQNYFHVVHLNPAPSQLTGQCSCRDWQVEGVPCVHTMKIARVCRVENHHLVHPLLRSTAGVGAFSAAAPFHPVDTANLVCAPEGSILPPQRLPPKSGRPKKNRLKGATEEGGKSKRKRAQCSGCGNYDHNILHCPAKRLGNMLGERREETGGSALS